MAPRVARVALNLNCWVRGEDSSRIFSVEIGRDKNVASLKEAIKEKKKAVFDNVDADSLVVWKVSIPTTDSDGQVDLEDKVKAMRLDGRNKLFPLKKLHKIFENLDEETLHVVIKAVEAPPILSTPAPSLLQLNCWVFGEESTRIFSVEIYSDKNVAGLKKAIKEEKKAAFDNVDADSLDIWNVSIPTDGRTSINEQVENLKVLKTKSLLPVKPLSDIFRNVVDEYLHVVVRDPSKRHVDLARVGELVEDITNVTLYVNELSKWSAEDLQLPSNGILLHFNFENPEPSQPSKPKQPSLSSNVEFPPHVKDLLDKLNKKRDLPRGDEVQRAFLKNTLSDRFLLFFDEVEGSGDTSEVRAYISAIKDCAPNVRTINEKSSYFKESHFTVFLVDPVFRDQRLYDKGVSADPAMVIKEVDNESDSRSYSPNSDFLLNTQYVPIVINETVSPLNESDRCRMLLQATVYVRVGNVLRTSRNLVILCFYLNTKFEAERYLVYQAFTNINQVEIVHDRKFVLSEPLQAFNFLFQLFNYKDALPDILGGFDDTRADTMKTLTRVLRNAYHAISSKSESQKDGSQTKGKKSRGGSDKLYTIQEHKMALILYGYNIIGPLKTHRHIAIAENRLHEEFVLKIVGRDELKFMEFLSSPHMLSDPRNHTIPFSHVTGIGHGKSIIAMPKLLPLDDIPLSSLQTAQCYDLLRQLVEGFIFLHRHGVAHMDLKSANIVIDTSLGRLYIIDFDLAHKVNGPDDTVSGFRGTKQWVAPEVDDDGFAYSAIRADLWAVGELILTVLALWHKGRTPNKDLEEVSALLQSKDPLKRPMLSDIFSTFDFSDGERVSSDMPLIQPDLSNNILLVH